MKAMGFAVAPRDGLRKIAIALIDQRSKRVFVVKAGLPISPWGLCRRRLLRRWWSDDSNLGQCVKRVSVSREAREQVQGRPL